VPHIKTTYKSAQYVRSGFGQWGDNLNRTDLSHEMRQYCDLVTWTSANLQEISRRQRLCLSKLRNVTAARCPSPTAPHRTHFCRALEAIHFSQRFRQSALVALEKQEGKPIERPQEREPTNVVNLMDALRRSVEADSGKAKAEKSKPKRATKPEQPKRKKTRKAG
jgi:hypothetical protein